MRHFLDTSAFVAFFVSDDRHHGAAVRVFESLTPTDKFWTSDYVLDETVTRMQSLLGHAAAVTAGRSILESPAVRLDKTTQADVDEAWLLFVRYKDQRLSFTDCTILAQSKRLGVDAIFTFDKGFGKVRAKTVP